MLFSFCLLVSDPDTEVKGTVKELAEKYGLSVMEMTGFLDGINESLVEANPIEEMEEDTVVSLKFDKEKLFPDVARHGVLCRKSFSVGSAPDKRFYLECRKSRWRKKGEQG